MQCGICLGGDGPFALADDVNIQRMLGILDQKILYNHPECKVLKQIVESTLSGFPSKK